MSNETRPKQELGGVLPDFSLPLISGGQASLTSLLENRKAAVVVFWSDTCSHCVRYDDYLNGFSARHPEIGFVAVAARRGESAETVKSAIDERKLTFPIVHDAEGTTAREWFAQQTPRAYLVSRDKRLVYRGAIDNFKFEKDKEFAAYLEPAIEELLAGKPVSRPETASFGCAVQSVYYILPKPIA
jgi:peroxiredoxin